MSIDDFLNNKIIKSGHMLYANKQIKKEYYGVITLKNSMSKINLFDELFRNSLNVYPFDSCSDGVEPKHHQYVRDQLEFDGITIFTDHYINSSVVDSVECDTKIAWLVEPKSIHSWTYDSIINFEHKFDYIFTHDAELLKRGPKYVLQLIASSRVKPEDQKIYPKTKLLSIIASDKNQTEGHKLRHEVIKKIKENNIECDLYGTGYKKFDSKLEPLKDYAFTIAIMNQKSDNFFTEVLTDCFLCGTIPIFWGCPNIHKWFERYGIHPFNKFEDILSVLKNETLMLDYFVNIELVKKNFEIAKKYTSTDDLLFENIKRLGLIK